MFERFLVLSFVVVVMGVPQVFDTKKFKVGIEYEHSLPMRGGYDRYRHRNNYEPFCVTITASARDGFVISYLEVTATVDAFGEVEFHQVRGQTGSKNIVFQLVSNQTDFLKYSYLTYGIREEEYKKMTNVISIPVSNVGPSYYNHFLSSLLLISLVISF